MIPAFWIIPLPSWNGIFRDPQRASASKSLPGSYAVTSVLVAFALNLLPFLSTLQGLSPLHHALSFFLPSLTMTGALIVTSVLLARGKTSGLSGFMALFIILLITTLVQVLHVMLSHDGSLWPHVIASFALLLCRVVMNGSGFVLFTLYCRTQRLARLAREMRLKSR